MLFASGDKSSATGASILSGTGPVTGTVKATPSQFHFHTHSEHLVNGMQYPLELHIGKLQQHVAVINIVI